MIKFWLNMENSLYKFVWGNFDQKFLCHGVGILNFLPNRPERIEWCRNLLSFIRNENESNSHSNQMGWKHSHSTPIPIRAGVFSVAPDPIRLIPRRKNYVIFILLNKNKKNLIIFAFIFCIFDLTNNFFDITIKFEFINNQNFLIVIIFRFLIIIFNFQIF